MKKKKNVLSSFLLLPLPSFFLPLSSLSPLSGRAVRRETAAHAAPARAPVARQEHVARLHARRQLGAVRVHRQAPVDGAGGQPARRLRRERRPGVGRQVDVLGAGRGSYGRARGADGDGPPVDRAGGAGAGGGLPGEALEIFFFFFFFFF